MRKRNIKKWRLSVWQAVFMALVFSFLGSVKVNASQIYDVSGGEIDKEINKVINEEIDKGMNGEADEEINRGSDVATNGKTDMNPGVRIPEKSLTKRIPLNAETVTQIPKYIAEEGILYVLDETAITIEETGYGSSEGADVVTTQKTIEALPDNDLARIEKTIVYEGITCKLLCVSYEITSRDVEGIPDKYTAVCEYGGLKKYSNSYAVDWEAVVRYDAYGRNKYPEEQAGGYEYKYGNFWQKNTRGLADKSKEPGDTEKEDTPDKPQHKLLVRKTPLKDQEWDGWKYLFLLMGIFLVAGILCALVYAVYHTLSNSAFLFSLTRHKKYRYIGHLRLKEKGGNCCVSLTERVISKAEILSFKIKIPEKTVKKAGKGMLMVQCPGEKTIMLILGKEIVFVLERA